MNAPSKPPSLWPALSVYTLIGLGLGGLYGAVEALQSLDQMKTTAFASGVASVLYRMILGAAFFAQVFVLSNLGASVIAIVLGSVSKGFRKTTHLAWALAASIVTGFFLPLGVIVNQLLPSIKSIESLLGNVLLLIAGLAAFVFLARALPIGPRDNNPATVRRVAIAIVLEAFFLTLLFTASNLPAIQKQTVQSPPDKTPPNIVLISIDTLRADHLSCYGYEGIRTTHIDRIARQGALFERALSPTSWTLPALATLLTGTQPDVHGMIRHDIGLPSGLETLPESLKKAGYTTMAVVTNEFLNHPYRLDRGFDGYVFSRDPEAYHPFAGLFLFDFFFTRINERHSAQSMTRRAIAMMRKNLNEPFFLWIHYIDPHSPYGAWYIDRMPAYDRGYNGPLGREFRAFAALDDGTLQPSQADKKHIQALYDAEILYVDRQIGRLWRSLEELAILDRTVLILTSDHGEEFWDHGDILHGRTLYRESIHVPLLIRYPGVIPPGLRVPGLTGLIQVPPAICEMAGVRPPETHQAVSLLDRWQANGTDPIFVSLDKLPPVGKAFESRGVYGAEANYLQWKVPPRGEQLFFTPTDWLQMQPVDRPDADRIESLRGLLDEKQKANDALRAHLGLHRDENKISLTPQMRSALKGLGYLN